jgi:hypothetical protein
MIGVAVVQKRRVLVTGAVTLAVAIPLLAWAQGSAPAAQDSTTRQPAVTAQPAAPAAAAPAAPAEPAMPALSDSMRAALRAQAEREVKSWADSLKLTPEQKEKARPIILDQAYQARQLRLKYSTMPKAPGLHEAMTRDLKALRESGDAKLAQVLTGEQMTKYKVLRDAMMARGRAKLGIAAPATPPAAAPAAPAAADTAKKK